MHYITIDGSAINIFDTDGPPASARDWLQSTPGEMAFNGVVQKSVEGRMYNFCLII